MRFVFALDTFLIVSQCYLTASSFCSGNYVTAFGELCLGAWFGSMLVDDIRAERCRPAR